jgi:hypothetical protein
MSAETRETDEKRCGLATVERCKREFDEHKYVDDQEQWMRVMSLTLRYGQSKYSRYTKKA